MSDTFIVIYKEDWEKIASEFNADDLPEVTEFNDTPFNIQLNKMESMIKGKLIKNIKDTLKEDWIDVLIEKPPYYRQVLCIDNIGNICVCWRACDDNLEDIYTINKSDNILQNVVKWKEIR